MWEEGVRIYGTPGVRNNFPLFWTWIHKILGLNICCFIECTTFDYIYIYIITTNKDEIFRKIKNEVGIFRSTCGTYLEEIWKFSTSLKLKFLLGTFTIKKGIFRIFKRTKAIVYIRKSTIIQKKFLPNSFISQKKISRSNSVISYTTKAY